VALFRQGWVWEDFFSHKEGFAQRMGNGTQKAHSESQKAQKKKSVLCFLSPVLCFLWSVPAFRVVANSFV
jgi:hypothetical protein